MGSHGKKKHKNKKKQKQNKTEEKINSPDEVENATENIENPDQHSEDETIESTGPQKREHSPSDDSDNEGEPKKKKKKKKPINVEGTSADKKNKKSIRQMKREKFAQRQADLQATAKDQLKSQCLSYLSQWKHDKTNWKFMKAKQAWLYKNKFSQSLVPNESWPLLMEYFESAKGNIRNLLLEDANKIIKQMDDWTESENKNNEETEESEQPAETQKPDDTVYKRARDLIQCLEE